MNLRLGYTPSPTPRVEYKSSSLLYSFSIFHACGVEAFLATVVTMTALGLLLLVLLAHQSVGATQVTFQNVFRSRIVESEVGVVATDHFLCSDIGVDVLKRGGKAVDAAIAVAFCLGVANPGASGIGGGDFMLVRLADGRAEAIDIRETAPRHASEVPPTSSLHSVAVEILPSGPF